MGKLTKAAFMAGALICASFSTPSYAQTTTSPTGGALPSGVTKVGGLVVDLKGTSGTRVVSQLAASQMYRGFANLSENPVPGVAPGNPLLFGTQTGYSQAVIDALGGGIASASFRITLFDGDSSAGDFDFNQNTFLVNGITVGNWSDVVTYRTDSTGDNVFSTGLGFGNNILSSGFFTLTDIGSLANLFTSIAATNQLEFLLDDNSPNDNFYDYTQGVDGGLINVGTGPIVNPGAVPEPSTWAMMLLGFGLLGAVMRARPRRRGLALLAA